MCSCMGPQEKESHVPALSFSSALRVSESLGVLMPAERWKSEGRESLAHCSTKVTKNTRGKMQ